MWLDHQEPSPLGRGVPWGDSYGVRVEAAFSRLCSTELANRRNLTALNAKVSPRVFFLCDRAPRVQQVVSWHTLIGLGRASSGRRCCVIESIVNSIREGSF